MIEAATQIPESVREDANNLLKQKQVPLYQVAYLISEAVMFARQTTDNPLLQELHLRKGREMMIIGMSTYWESQVRSYVQFGQPGMGPCYEFGHRGPRIRSFQPLYSLEKTVLGEPTPFSNRQKRKVLRHIAKGQITELI